MLETIKWESLTIAMAMLVCGTYILANVLPKIAIPLIQGWIEIIREYRNDANKQNQEVCEVIKENARELARLSTLLEHRPCTEEENREAKR